VRRDAQRHFFNSVTMPDSAAAILILEDTRTVQNYIRDVLRPVEAAHRVLLARRVKEAQAIAAGTDIALFIVDIGLPDGDGIDFLCEMSMLHPESRALVITSTPTDDFRERARQLGVLNFMAKPLERRVLLDAVRKLLAPPDAPVGEYSGFEATLGGLSPVDIIQLKCLRGTTGAIELREEHLFAQVWFQRGEIVHAECRLPGAEHAGIDALQCLLTWRIGCIREVHNPRGVRKTIFTPWQQLLMEADAQATEAVLA
jgi:DNA-binding response OmpR family regulator